MNKPKISVILPCYHVAQYLPEIFKDLTVQTFSDFEMIFVNDGDPKLSPILADLAKQDSRAVVIEKENGGVSSARNVGMDKAQGEWIVFVDPDDRVEPYYLKSLYDAVADSGVFIGIGGCKVHYVGQGVWVDHTLKITPPPVRFRDCKVLT